MRRVSGTEVFRIRDRVLRGGTTTRTRAPKPDGECCIIPCHERAAPGEDLCPEHVAYYRIYCRTCGQRLQGVIATDKGECHLCRDRKRRRIARRRERSERRSRKPAHHP